jgi:16S rRNA (cytosine1402-N4)-methyltransferase
MSEVNNNIPNSDYHIPVLLNETISGLNIKPDGTYVDCTFGGGGHSHAILQHLNPKGKLFVFDQDADAQKNVPDDDRIFFIPQNFKYVQKFLRLQKVTAVDGILADLGVSSHQFDEPARGFSIRYDAALDMRMDQRQTLTAAQIIATFTETQLHKLFEQNGELTNSKTLAKTIVEKRTTTNIKTINQFKQAVQNIVKGNPQKYFAQVFQALRIEVNNEFGVLKDLLTQSIQLLKPGGRVAIITFHSLEDRIVKNFYKNGTFDELPPDEIYGVKHNSGLVIVTKKPVIASVVEQKNNSRSRSAKLRVAEKIKNTK